MPTEYRGHGTRRLDRDYPDERDYQIQLAMTYNNLEIHAQNLAKRLFG